ncbi:MAG: GNAT family protein [Clostridiaceae bacterium]|nr:GNAT family protein [Clostridiaceae bacterium]
MRYFKKIIGERIYLSPMNTDDAEIYTKWLNDYEVMRCLGGYGKSYSLSAERAALEKLSAEGQNFSIIRASDDTLLGSVSLMDVDQRARKATLGIFIGEAENRGKGYGAEAIRLITGYGFNTLNLHNIMLVVHADNARAIACYQKVGFREFGRRTDACFKDGKYIDEVYMEILG